jgi:hypothetical protein
VSGHGLTTVGTLHGHAAGSERLGGPIVATVRVEAQICASAQQVWEAVADVGAVHHRLLPGRVAGTRIASDTRILTMPDGSQIRELIITVDHTLRRLVYAVTQGHRLPITYHHAAFEVVDDGEHSRLVWVTDILPNQQAGAVQARVERAIIEIKQALEAAEANRPPDG